MKAKLIEEHCKDDEFVVDVDGNDEFIGREVFGLLNAYLNEMPETWFLVGNSLYEEQKEMVPASPPKVSAVWDYFYMDRVKVYKRKLYLNAARRPFVDEENHVNLMMYQFSGERFHYVSEFLSVDTQTDLYG